MSSVFEHATPGFLVWRLSMKWRVAVDRAVAPLGLTHAQYSLVASLYGMHHAGLRPSQRQLADHTGLEPLYVSKLARSLETAGIVDRTRDPADPRAVRLSLTQDGQTVARRAIRVVHGLLDQLLGPLGGFDGERTRAFSGELATLLGVSLDPRVDHPAGTDADRTRSGHAPGGSAPSEHAPSDQAHSSHAPSGHAPSDQAHPTQKHSDQRRSDEE